MRENPENLGFTFFGFLPPYLGVSDSLAYFTRRGLKRSIVSYQKFLISCLVARYSAFFVFKSMENHGNPWKSMEKYKIDTTEFNLLPNERLESFWDALWLGIRTFLCFKMSNWSHFGGNFHENYGRQWLENEKWTPKAAYRRRMVHIISPCVRPKRTQKQNIFIFPMNFEGSRGPRGSPKK